MGKCCLAVKNGELVCNVHGQHNVGVWSEHSFPQQQHKKTRLPMRHILYTAYKCSCGSKDILIDEDPEAGPPPSKSMLKILN